MIQPYFLQKTNCYFSFKRFRGGAYDKFTSGNPTNIKFFVGNSKIPTPFFNNELCPAEYAFKPQGAGRILHEINLNAFSTVGLERPIDYQYIRSVPSLFRNNGYYSTTYIIQSANNWRPTAEYYEVAGMEIRFKTSGPDAVDNIRLKFFDLFPREDCNIYFDAPVFRNESDILYFVMSLPEANGRSLSISFDNTMNSALYQAVEDILFNKGWVVNGNEPVATAMDEPASAEEPTAMEEPASAEEPTAMEEPASAEEPTAMEEPVATEQPGAE